MPLLTKEIAVLRAVRQHADSQFFFPISAVPIDSLNVEFRKLCRRGYIIKHSSVCYQISNLGLNALHLADVADEQSAQRHQETSEQRAYEDAARAAERAHLDQQAKKQFRHDWRVTAVNLIGGFILGAIADHFFDIVGNAARAVLSLLQLH